MPELIDLTALTETDFELLVALWTRDPATSPLGDTAARAAGCDLPAGRVFFTQSFSNPKGKGRTYVTFTFRCDTGTLGVYVGQPRDQKRWFWAEVPMDALPADPGEFQKHCRRHFAADGRHNAIGGETPIRRTWQAFVDALRPHVRVQAANEQEGHVLHARAVRSKKRQEDPTVSQRVRFALDRHERPGKSTLPRSEGEPEAVFPGAAFLGAVAARAYRTSSPA